MNGLDDPEPPLEPVLDVLAPAPPELAAPPAPPAADDPPAELEPPVLVALPPADPPPTNSPGRWLTWATTPSAGEISRVSERVCWALRSWAAAMSTAAKAAARSPGWGPWALTALAAAVA